MFYKFFVKPLALAEISRNIAEVLFAMLFIGPLLTEEFNGLLAFSGLFFSLFFWVISLFLEKR